MNPYYCPLNSMGKKINSMENKIKKGEEFVKYFTNKTISKWNVYFRALLGVLFRVSH